MGHSFQILPDQQRFGPTGKVSNRGVYKISHLDSDKVYIGSSKDLQNRWPSHSQQLNRNDHHSILLQRAWNKYGKDKFVFEILEFVDESMGQQYLRDREQYWLDFYQSYIPKNGYNISKKAQCIDIPPYERTEEHKKDMSEKMLGRVLTKEWREKISKTRKERQIPNVNKGKRFGTKSETIKKKEQIKEFCLKYGYRPTAESNNLNECKLGKALQHYTDIKRPEYDIEIVNFIKGFVTRKRFNQILKRINHGS